MNIVSRIPTELARERVAWSPHGPTALPPGREQPRPDQVVQGVVVQPPRETKVSVRVEIVSESERQREDLRHAEAESSSSESNRSQASWISVAELPPSAAGRLGAPDLQRAASAYRVHADWQPYAGASGEPPRRLSIRA